MNLADTKLADITTGNKVRGSALGNLASIPSSAGYIPSANINITLVSIPNASLLPITLTSWVDGAAMRNIQSMPSLAGQLAYYSIVSSLASGGSIRFDGVSKFVGSPLSTNSAIASLVSTAGDIKGSGLLAAYSDSESSTSSLSTVKLKEIEVGKSGSLTISFELKGDAGQQNAAIYKNGSQVGTLRSNTSTTYIYYIENISGWQEGDLCQLYGDKDTSGTMFVRNFRIYDGSIYNFRVIL